MSVRTSVRNEFHVAGMTCRHCALSVSEEVGGIDGVSSVDVELATGSVTVVAVREIGRDEVGAALSHVGFALAG
jgi:copper chaperone CopZ